MENIASKSRLYAQPSYNNISVHLPSSPDSISDVFIVVPVICFGYQVSVMQDYVWAISGKSAVTYQRLKLINKNKIFRHLHSSNFVINYRRNSHLEVL